MANLVESINWESGIYQLEESDLVLAGANGISNLQGKQLANRTSWLRNKTGTFDNIHIFQSNIALTKEHIQRNLIVFSAENATLSTSLPTLDLGDKGVRLTIVAINVNKSQVTITSAANMIIGIATKHVVYLGDGESIEFVWTGGVWLQINFDGNKEVGKPEFDFSVRPNTVIAQGTLLNRADYPRLWEYVQSLPNSVYPDFNWTSSPDYKGYYSSGNGSTTFRVPDLRAMFIRGLDLGAGLDLGRPHGNNPGGPEADELKSHSHTVPAQGLDARVDNSNGNTLDLGGARPLALNSSPAGGLETRPKNIGLIPLIRV